MERETKRAIERDRRGYERASYERARATASRYARETRGLSHSWLSHSLSQQAGTPGRHTKGAKDTKKTDYEKDEATIVEKELVDSSTHLHRTCNAHALNTRSCGYT
jgi:hypothetical protein